MTPKAEVTALVTLQFSYDGLVDRRPADNDTVHLVRSTSRSTPGRTLCGIDRFAKDGPGWSIGGGITGPNIVHRACSGCVATAREEFAGLPVRGTIGAQVVRDALAEAVACDVRGSTLTDKEAS